MFKSEVEMLVRMICVLICLKRIDLYRYRFVSVTEILNRPNFEQSKLSKSVPKETFICIARVKIQNNRAP